MKPLRFSDNPGQSSLLAKFLIGLVVLISAVAGLLAVGFLTEVRSQAQPAPVTMTLNPTSVLIGSGVVVEGKSWQPGHTVEIYLDEAPRDAVASAVVDSQGHFTTGFLVPADPRWQQGLVVPVLAQTEDTAVSAKAVLIINSSQPTPSPTPTATETPFTPTATVPPASPPEALITGSVAAQGGQAIEFNAGNSKANNGYQIATYAWDFGDGQTGQGVQISHSYSTAGTYQVSLTVTDDHGLSSSATQTVEVLTAPVSRPLASISGAGQAQVGQIINFSGNGSQANNNDSIVSYAWNFGDGGQGNGANVSHSYNAAGNYRVTLTVTDNQGLNGSASIIVQIIAAPNIAPVAIINGPTVADIGQGVTFDAGSSYANGGGQITNFTWNFGDGGMASGSSVGHSYGSSGSYVVTLTVTDNQGLTGTASLTIQINNNENNEDNEDHDRPSVKMSLPATV